MSSRFFVRAQTHAWFSPPDEKPFSLRLRKAFLERPSENSSC
jgi:hypothetical protein